MAATVTVPGALFAIGSVYRFNLYTFLTNQIGITGISYKVNSVGASIPTLGDGARFILDAVDAAFRACVSSAATVLGARMSWQGVPPKGAAGVAELNSAGTGGASALPRQTCPILKTTTLSSVFGERGRMFFPFPPVEAALANGGMDPAFSDLVKDAGDILIAQQIVTAGAATATLDAVVWNRTLSTAYPIYACQSAGLFGTQKSRSQYGRTNAPTIPL